jgi:hypothetical protein
MDRRSFVKLGAAAVMMPSSYDSPTISVTLAEETHGITAVLLTEHGDADYCVVEAFYWKVVNNVRLLLHKETTAALAMGLAAVAEIPLPLVDIVFLRVRELKTLNQTQFGDAPR